MTEKIFASNFFRLRIAPNGNLVLQMQGTNKPIAIRDPPRETRSWRDATVEDVTAGGVVSTIAERKSNPVSPPNANPSRGNPPRRMPTAPPESDRKIDEHTSLFSACDLGKAIEDAFKAGINTASVSNWVGDKDHIEWACELYLKQVMLGVVR